MTTIGIKFTKAAEQQFSYTTTNGGAAPFNVRIPASGQINWTINSYSEPSGMRFSDDPPGIVFAPTSSRPAIWPGPAPEKKTATLWTVNDSVSNATKGTFAYTINLVSPTNNTLYSHDPDVTNTPPG